MRDHYPDMEKPAYFDPSRFQPDEIKLFSPMKSESLDIAGYLRTGGCTAGCGACCTAFVVPIDAAVRANCPREGYDFVDVAGPAHRVQVPIDPVVVGKPGFDDWERWLGLHDAWLLQASCLPNCGILTADLPVTVEKDPGPMTTDEWFAWLEEQGVVLIQRGPQVLAYITRKCDEVGEDGQCQVFGTSKRPKMCGEYPRHPSDINGLESFCTYKFTTVSRAEVVARNIAGQKRSQLPRKKKGKKKRGRH